MQTKKILGFRTYYVSLQDTIQPVKKTFIMETTKEERDYLNKVFDQNYKDTTFSANDGKYELYYPYFFNNKRGILKKILNQKFFHVQSHLEKISPLY